MEQKAGSQRHEISENLLPVGRTGIDAGVFAVSLTKARGYVDPYVSLLGYFIFAGFTLLLLGMVALYVRYAPVSGRLGK